jgi:hypothetical protein
MIEDKNILMIILFFVFGILFVVFMNLQAHQIYKLKRILRESSPKFYDIIFLWKYGIPGFLIPHPIKIVNYVWSNKNITSLNREIIYKIRLYQLLALLFFVLALLSPLISGVVLSVMQLLGVQ